MCGRGPTPRRSNAIQPMITIRHPHGNYLQDQVAQHPLTDVKPNLGPDWNMLYTNQIPDVSALERDTYVTAASCYDVKPMSANRVIPVA